MKIAGPWTIAILVALVIACSKAPGAELAVGIAGQTDLLRPHLTVFATAGRWERAWRGVDIGSEAAPTASMPVQTPASGTLVVRAVLTTADAMVLATGETQLVLESDWRWGVTVWWTNRDPALDCFGCSGRVAIAIPDELRTSPADSLYIVWGGNSIRNPVIY
jgi:hypothetical protein